MHSLRQQEGDLPLIQGTMAESHRYNCRRMNPIFPSHHLCRNHDVRKPPPRHRIQRSSGHDHAFLSHSLLSVSLPLFLLRWRPARTGLGITRFVGGFVPMRWGFYRQWRDRTGVKSISTTIRRERGKSCWKIRCAYEMDVSWMKSICMGGQATGINTPKLGGWFPFGWLGRQGITEFQQKQPDHALRRRGLRGSITQGLDGWSVQYSILYNRLYGRRPLLRGWCWP